LFTVEQLSYLEVPIFDLGYGTTGVHGAIFMSQM